VRVGLCLGPEIWVNLILSTQTPRWQQLPGVSKFSKRACGLPCVHVWHLEKAAVLVPYGLSAWVAKRSEIVEPTAGSEGLTCERRTLPVKSNGGFCIVGNGT
jgi:hypothetical protein